MRRREFITLIGGAALAWPMAARAQQPVRMRRIGVLLNGVEADPEMQARNLAFRQALERLGWREGHNVRIDYRFTSADPTRYQPLANELVSLQPDAILVHTTPLVEVMQRETRAIPIVFVGVSDPIGSGFVATLARPRGNLTGLLLYEDGIAGKWLAMLKEIAPRLTRAALVANPKTTAYDYFLRSANAAAPALAIEVVSSPVDAAAEYERAIEAFAHVPNGGLVVLPDSFNISHRDLIVALADRYRSPAVYTGRYFVTAGGLMSYSTDVVDHTRQAASYINSILRGATAADLPVQSPTKYETVLNLKTAKALGLDVPPSLLVRADEVIE